MLKLSYYCTLQVHRVDMEEEHRIVVVVRRTVAVDMTIEVSHTRHSNYLIMYFLGGRPSYGGDDRGSRGPPSGYGGDRGGYGGDRGGGRGGFGESSRSYCYSGVL